MKPEKKGGGEMKTLHQIQNEVAKEKYNCSFIYATSFLKVLDMRDFMQEVAKRYAAECITELREKCATHQVGDEWEVRGVILSVEKLDEFLFDNDLIN